MEIIKSLTNVILFIFIGSILIIFLKLLIKSKSNTKKIYHSPIEAQKLLTEHEKTMFYEIKKALPFDLHIFVQVSFGGLLKTKLNKTRWTFIGKRADFVICDKNFNVLAIIELDDKSHDTIEQKNKDKKRDEMLKNAGYKVLRYRYMPTIKQLQNDILS